jgi:DNA-binding NarL/FixJ family response regulator
VSTIRLFIVEDQEIVRSGLRHLIASEPAIELVGEACSGEEALLLVQRACPDVLLVDIRMPGMDGIEATRKLKALLPKTRILMLTAHSEDYATAIAAGADGYLAKDISGAELIRAILGAAQGQSPIYLSLPTRELPSLIANVAARSTTHDLSSRQMEVLRLLARGETNAFIAQKLFLSERTIKREVSDIFQKLGVGSRAEAVACAYQQGLL